MIEPIEGVIRDYPWGSRSALAQLLGTSPSGEPQAELWLGANPAAPSTLVSTGMRLDRLIESDPVAALGPEATARFGRLPFLLKVLAVESPLSLQAHPSAEQAAAGHRREQSHGIPVDAPQRVFKDPRHKPELVCALNRFEALCGFRDPLASLSLLCTLRTPALDPLRRRLECLQSGRWGDLMRWLLARDLASLPARQRMADEAVAACASNEADDRWSQERALAARLGELHPGDPAVVAALLLERVVLEPGDAMFVGAGCLHAYLQGTAVEIMADSDNTLRGGLTAKAVDVGELARSVDNGAVGPVVQRSTGSSSVVSYRAPVTEFSLTRADIEGSVTLPGGPALLLCVDGSAADGAVTLHRGHAAWLGAACSTIELTGRATVFRAGLGLPRPHDDATA